MKLLQTGRQNIYRINTAHWVENLTYLSRIGTEIKFKRTALILKTKAKIPNTNLNGLALILVLSGALLFWNLLALLFWHRLCSGHLNKNIWFSDIKENKYMLGENYLVF